MKSKTEKQIRSTLQKQLDKIGCPRHRLKALLEAGGKVPNARRDAELFVGRWQAIHALMQLDEKVGLESQNTDQAIRNAWEDSADALSAALARWDAGFFEAVAKAMRCANSALPVDRRLAYVQIALATGEWTPRQVAERLTTGNSNANFASTLRQVRRDFRRFRRG